MLQGIGTAGRSFWRRPWLKRGCCANDDDDDDDYCQLTRRDTAKQNAFLNSTQRN